jgi:hypothetical protein
MQDGMTNFHNTQVYADETVSNKLFFCGEQLLAPKLEGHPLSTVHDCLVNIFLQLLSISGVRLRHLLPEDAPCYGDRPHLMWTNGRIL